MEPHKEIINAAQILFQERKIQLFLLTEKSWDNLFEGKHQKVLTTFFCFFLSFFFSLLSDDMEYQCKNANRQMQPIKTYKISKNFFIIFGSSCLKNAGSWTPDNSWEPCESFQTGSSLGLPWGHQHLWIIVDELVLGTNHAAFKVAGDTSLIQ